jgi:hypothetical protein
MALRAKCVDAGPCEVQGGYSPMTGEAADCSGVAEGGAFRSLQRMRRKPCSSFRPCVLQDGVDQLPAGAVSTDSLVTFGFGYKF